MPFWISLNILERSSKPNMDVKGFSLNWMSKWLFMCDLELHHILFVVTVGCIQKTKPYFANCCCL